MGEFLNCQGFSKIVQFLERQSIKKFCKLGKFLKILEFKNSHFLERTIINSKINSKV